MLTDPGRRFGAAAIPHGMGIPATKDISMAATPTSLFARQPPGIMDQLMRDFGFSLEQAAGVLGNIGRESGGFRHLRELGQPAGKGGYGWCQWTGPRRDRFLNWCRERGLDWTADAANYGYLAHELGADYRGTVAAVRVCHDLAGATQAFEQHFEAAGVPALDDRIRWAEQARAAYLAAHAKGHPPGPTQ